MSETITLPRSGIVLTFSRMTLSDYVSCDNWHCELGPAQAWIAESVGSGRGFDCGIADDGTSFPTKAECIAWLDEKCLALRAALMPQDAVERVATWIAQSETTCCGIRSCDCAKDGKPACACCRDDARAVLAALGVDHA